MIGHSPHFMITRALLLPLCLFRNAALVTIVLMTVGPVRGAGFAYTWENALPRVVFSSPTQLVFAPGEQHRAFVVELGGRVAVIRDLERPTREVFLDLSAMVGDNGPDHGALSLAFHQRFAENGEFFLWYSLVRDGKRYQRLSRFLVSASNPQRADASTETPLITQATGPGGHDGGTLVFGSDGYLYLSLGDGDESVPEAAESRQRIDRSFFGAIVRLDVDRKPGNLLPNPHPSVHPGTYFVPADNPFVGATAFLGEAVQPASVRTEFWALGLRNPFRMAFDAATGRLWCGDVGLNLREEVNVIERGGNYGWDLREGTLAGPSLRRTPGAAVLLSPLWEYGQDLGQSVTGGLVYRASRYPELQGRYVFADFLSGRVWTLHADGARPVNFGDVRQIATQRGLVAFAVHPGTGHLLATDFFTGRIQRLVSAPAGDAASSRLANLSSRGFAGTGERAMVAGFAVSGGARTLLLRAVGPGLQSFGVAGAIPRPTLVLRDSTGMALDQNNGWENSARRDQLTSAAARVGAFPLATGRADAALLVTLPPGLYTASVEPTLNTPTGVALVEIYEADEATSANARLSNISTRAYVGEQDGVLISGLVIGGTAPRTVLLRVAGPALRPFGVSGLLEAPRLQLFVEGEPVITNEAWQQAPDLAALERAMTVAGLRFAPDSNDGAILATLQPGAYTVHVSGRTATTGVALVEVYEVSP